MIRILAALVLAVSVAYAAEPPAPAPAPAPEAAPAPAPAPVALAPEVAKAVLDVALTVEERMGVRRTAEPVAGGVPLPKGLIKDLATLRVVDDLGKETPAQFTKLGTWWEDGSVKWALVEFLADVAPGSERVWRLRNDGGGQAKTSYLKVEKTAEGFTVDTGRIKFTVKSSGFNVLDKVWLDDTGKQAYDDDHLVASGGSDLTVASSFPNLSEYREYKASEFAGTKVELEESGPMRATIKVTGAHGPGGENRMLDYTLRIHAYNDKSYVRLVYTAECRQGSLSTCVPVDRWTVRLVPAFQDELLFKYAFGAEGMAVTGDMRRGDQRAYLYQESSDRYFLGGKAYHGSTGVLSGHGKTTKPPALGWAELSGGRFAVMAGVRYFWQLHPKALEIDPKGGLQLHLWPNFAKHVGLVSGESGERQARFFGGMSKTHEMLVYFHAVPGGDRDGAWAFLQKPLFAKCPTSWYCQETRVLGRLVDATPAAYKPEYREDVRRFDGHMKKSLDSLFARRDFNRGRDGYGLFNFGDHINYVEEDRRDKAGEIPGGPDTHWDNNYYRFPHLMFLQFLRTGDAGYFDMGMECQQHHADIDSLCWPENVAGAARYSAGPDHIRQVDEHLRCAGIYVSDSFNHFKLEQHFDRYYLTGDRGAWEAGMRSARFALAMGTKGISQNRSTGHGAFALLAGYQATGDKKYLEAARELAMGQGKANTIGLGIAADGARSYYEVTGDMEARAKAVGIAKEMMASAKINRKPVEGDGVQAAAFAYGCNGDQDRLDAALNGLRSLADQGPAQEVHGFALTHSGSVYALWFLTDKARDEK